MSSSDKVEPEVLEEGCYYLSKLGLTQGEIAKKFEITRNDVAGYKASYTRKLKAGRIALDSFDKAFWKGVKAEAEGDSKVTFVSEKGFHHAWKSDLKKLDGPSLLAIFESSRAFLDMDPNQRFLEYPAPKGYDPLALPREVKRALGVISSIMEEKWETEKGRTPAKPQTPNAEDSANQT